MKVAVVYNDDGDMKPSLNTIERRGEAAVVDSARDIAASLSERHEAILIPIARSLRDSLASIQAADPGIVFNLCEGVQGESRWESHFALLLEMLAIPFTGCSAIPLALCQDKALVKRLLASEGVSTPRGRAVAREDAAPRVAGLLDELGGQAIVKPSREDGGIGIAKGSVVHNDSGLTKRISFIHSTYDQPALVEEFIDGDELNLAFYQSSDGWVFLPPGEVAFADSLSAEQRIRSLDKDQDGSITQGEIPATFSVTLGLGSAGFGTSGFGGPSLRPVDRPAAVGLQADGPPEWFTRMDRNGDGDLTLKEFLGDGSDFRKLDINRDGLIEPKEARAAVAGE